MKRIVWLVLCLLAPLTLLACAPTHTSTVHTEELALEWDYFYPQATSIGPGDTITFKNESSVPHTLITGMYFVGPDKTVTLSEDPGAPDFGSQGHTIKPGESWTTPPWEKTGIFYIRCIPPDPEEMGAAINVIAAITM